MAAQLDQQVRDAIAAKRLLQLRYHGALRVVEPHDYGILKGTARLLVYQLRGAAGASRKSASGWRLLDVPLIEACTVMAETFPGSRGASHQRHHEWDVVYARVA